MSTKYLNALLRSIFAGTPTQKFILAILCFHANNDGFCFPSYKTLQKESGFDKRTVVRAIKSLEELGIIEVQKRLKRGNCYTSNVYKIKWEKINGF